MIALNDVSFEFAGNYLYKDINWHIKPRERIGLVGRNGSGKTTLLRLITGEYELREGSISMSKELRLGYLHQEMAETLTDSPIRDVAMQAFAKCLKIEEELAHIYSTMGENPDDDTLKRLGDLQEDFERLGGYEMKSKTEEILEGLGFSTPDLDRPLSEFSGGWRMRVILARMLLEQPDLLILDEPTNHLDLPSIEWLENYLQSYNGTVIVVSHDRTFLNRMVTKIVELMNKNLYVWEGNYDFFLKAKQERDDLQRRQYDNQQQFIKDQEKFINRFRAKASKATAVQSRVKMLEKLDRIEEVQEDGPTMRLHFDINRPSGKVVMELEDIHKAFDENLILDGGNGIIERGDKIALIGANGKGKSTLLRIINGSESFEGTRKEGHAVQMAFYAQHQLEALNLKNTVLDELQDHATDMTETEVRSVLGCFLFGGEEVDKKVRVLSGGEKSRVALAKTLVERANFLLLDEPTNHLDIQSIEVLIDALRNYSASFVLVSHDRNFITRTANKIWWIEGHQIKEYPGTFDEYQHWMQKREAATAATTKKVEQKPKVQKVRNNADDNRKRNEKRKLDQKIEKLEAKITAKKEEIGTLEAELSDPKIAGDHEQITRLSNQHLDLDSELSILEEKMESYIEQLIDLEG